MGAPAKASNTILCGDCIVGLNGLPAGSVDLVFADPPFNIGYDYDVYDDAKDADDYLKWSRRWISAVHRVLSPSGTFWLAIGDEYAAELKLLSQEIGFTCRSWVVWYYTFGVNCKYKFTRSHAHLFYFVKDPDRFTFRSDELENRIPSARQLVYADSRANPTGRLPDDTWVLRPQDLADCFTTSEDTWYLPRVAGTFKERAGFHGCQMPEQLLGRIIRLCSTPGQFVVDPFSGSATTVAVAKKLGRRYLAFDLSQDYVTRGLARLEAIRLGDALEGAPEPTLSAPITPTADTQRSRRAAAAAHTQAASQRVPTANAKLLEVGLLEAFRQTHEGFSLDRIVADPALNQRLAHACTRLGLPGEPRTWNWTLFGMRKAGQLAEFPTMQRTEFSCLDREAYTFASEIAWRKMIDSGCESLDGILCDPFLAAEFDQIAARWAPGFTSLQYRWAAITLRKSAKTVRARAELLTEVCFRPHVPLEALQSIPTTPGIYVISVADQDIFIYAGETSNLNARIAHLVLPLRQEFSESLVARYFQTSCMNTDRVAYQHRVVARHAPRLNLQALTIA